MSLITASGHYRRACVVERAKAIYRASQPKGGTWQEAITQAYREASAELAEYRRAAKQNERRYA